MTITERIAAAEAARRRELRISVYHEHGGGFEHWWESHCEYCCSDGSCTTVIDTWDEAMESAAEHVAKHYGDLR